MTIHIGPRTISAIGGSIKRVGNYRIHTFPSELVTDGLVLNLDAGDPRSYPGSGTTWTDLSGNGNTGTLTNGPTYSNANGGSIVFDGINDYVVSTTANNLGNTNSSPSISIEMWAKITRKSGGGQQFQHIAGYRTSNFQFYFLLLDASGATVPTEARVVTASGTYDVIVDFAPYIGVWTHIVFTATSNRSNLYINGSLVGTNTSISGNFGSSSGNFTVGITPTDLTSFAANGNISSVKVYNRALSAAEVAQNYDALKVRYTSYTNTFTPLCGGGSGKVEVLCVAGGGGGAVGGGGAGGLLYNSAFTINSNISIGVTVGAGGTGAQQWGLNGLNGQNSVFSSLTSFGGGYGGHGGEANSGGSGGGAGYAGVLNASATVGQGNSGGKGGSGLDGSGLGGYPGGGGGGAGSSGGNAVGTLISGNGGSGLSYSISGSSRFYAGGGGGATQGTVGTKGVGGSGVGGDGTSGNGIGLSAIPNTGSGGGGSGSNYGANGSNGIVIVRYPATDYNVELLIVGGGGGGGVCWGGGGGAGGLVYYSSYPVSAGTKYTVTVGAGGTNRIDVSGNGFQGNNTIFGPIIAYGGGYGGGNCGNVGGNGGSGGGGSGNGSSGVAGGSGILGQGNSGATSSAIEGAGGGGAGSSGSGRQGGNGLAFSITGISSYYGGGGSGGGSPSLSGGLGGGGTGGTALTAGVADATANTGGGGGGSIISGSGVSGIGGSGIIIIAYQGPQRGIGGTVNTTSRPGYTLHTFTTTGTDFFIP